MESVLGGQNVDDDILVQELQGQGETQLHDVFFNACLTAKLPKSAMYLITQDKESNTIDKALSSAEEPSIIFKISEEEVILEIMKTYSKGSLKIMSTEDRLKENLLHFFIRNRFTRALNHFLHTIPNKEEMRQLCFQPNRTKRIPLMSSIRQGMENSAMELWKLLETMELEACDKDPEAD